MMSKPKMYLDIETMENVFKDKFPAPKVQKKEKDEPVRLAFISTRNYDVDVSKSFFSECSIASGAISQQKVTMCQCILICDSSVKVDMISTEGTYKSINVIDLEDGSCENASDLAHRILMNFVINRPSRSDEPGYRDLSNTSFRMLDYNRFNGYLAVSGHKKINVEECLINKDAYFTIKDITRTIFNNIGYNSGNQCNQEVIEQIDKSSKEFVDKFNAEKEQKDKETWKRLTDLT